MQFVYIGLFICALLVLAIGYRRNSRNILLLGALFLYSAGGAADYIVAWGLGTAPVPHACG